VATRSGEGHDRENLNLDDIPYSTAGRWQPNASSDHIVSRVAEEANNVIVVMVHPGAILTPWRDDVDAIFAAFLPGQEYGRAVVDLLWGEVEPTARLPLTLPASEDQLGFTKEQYPGVPREDSRPKEGWITDTTYSEKLEVGYRYYDAHDLEPAFAFGHGLGYTTVTYSDLHADKDKVTFSLHNSGERDGVEVVQLYLGFPSNAGEPPKQLKGFKQVSVKQGESMKVTLPLDARALSIWDVGSHSWQVQHGTFTAMVGASSRDIRLTDTFEVKSGVMFV
jgi:beta-glucosidase